MFRIDVKDSVAFKEMYEMGIKDGIQQGIQRGIQQGIQQGIKQGIQQGFREGEYKKAIEIARALYKLGVDLEKIKRATKLSVDELKRILKQ
jgi:predicted transposase/invertase (TIGR01784 family)